MAAWLNRYIFKLEIILQEEGKSIWTVKFKAMLSLVISSPLALIRSMGEIIPLEHNCGMIVVLAINGLYQRGPRFHL